MMQASESPFTQLHQELVGSGRADVRWDNMLAARKEGEQVLARLAEALPKGLPLEDASVVVSGSLGRGDFTKGSDIDWNFLLDGVADPRHFDLARDIGDSIANFAKATGREGTFGGLIVSHDLIHRIGGEPDSNANLTRRILLLLESLPIRSGDCFRPDLP